MSIRTIRIQARNNSDARDFRVLADMRTVSVRHNGGKLVIATVDAADLDEAKGLLDGSHAVASYEVQS